MSDPAPRPDDATAQAARRTVARVVALTPVEDYPPNIAHVQWTFAAATLWHDLRLDRSLPASLLSGSVDAGHVPGVSHPRHGPQGSDANGLCA